MLLVCESYPYHFCVPFQDRLTLSCRIMTRRCRLELLYLTCSLNNNSILNAVFLLKINIYYLFNYCNYLTLYYLVKIWGFLQTLKDHIDLQSKTLSEFKGENNTKCCQ